MSYKHTRSGDKVKVEIRDHTRKILFRKKFNVQNKQAIYEVLKELEKFSGYSIHNLIQQKLKVGEWW